MPPQLATHLLFTESHSPQPCCLCSSQQKFFSPNRMSALARTHTDDSTATLLPSRGLRTAKLPFYPKSKTQLSVLDSLAGIRLDRSQLTITHKSSSAVMVAYPAHGVPVSLRCEARGVGAMPADASTITALSIERTQPINALVRNESRGDADDSCSTKKFHLRCVFKKHG